MINALIILGVFCLGLLTGMITLRYGLRVGNKLTISAINNEPLDEKTMSRAVDIKDRTE